MTSNARRTAALCDGCNAPVIWARTAATGAAMAVDARPTEDGTVVLEVRGDARIAHVVGVQTALSDDLVRYRAHAASCDRALVNA